MQATGVPSTFVRTRGWTPGFYVIGENAPGRTVGETGIANVLSNNLNLLLWLIRFLKFGP
jgi:hypothetical protein